MENYFPHLVTLKPSFCLQRLLQNCRLARSSKCSHFVSLLHVGLRNERLIDLPLSELPPPWATTYARLATVYGKSRRAK